MDTLEQKEEKVGDVLYILTAFPTMIGLEIQSEIMACTVAGLPFPPTLIKKAVCQGATIGSARIDDKKFDKHFSKKYQELMELFYKILAFNFGGVEDEESPNEESDTSAQ